MQLFGAIIVPSKFNSARTIMEKLRYSTKEAQIALGIGLTKFWGEVRAGRLSVYYDGNKAYCTRETLVQYDAECQRNTVSPGGRAVPGVKGLQRKPVAA